MWSTLILPRLPIIAAERFQLELEISELSSYDALTAIENDNLDLTEKHFCWYG